MLARSSTLLPPEYQGPETSLTAGRFAFESGHYDRAEDLYRGWFDSRQHGDQVEYLNEVAWNLYLMGRDLDAALSLAREAYEHDPDPNVGDTLARLLYRAGDVEEALRIQNAAVMAAEGRPMAESLRAAAEVMAEGGDLGDEPDFESYPGAKRI
jgi:tetratricopeptide (TPR) repeat protein